MSIQSKLDNMEIRLAPGFRRLRPAYFTPFGCVVRQDPGPRLMKLGGQLVRVEDAPQLAHRQVVFYPAAYAGLRVIMPLRGPPQTGFSIAPIGGHSPAPRLKNKS